MLEQLLTELRSGGTFETGELAARLGTTPEMVKVMLEHLQRSGYIQPFNTCNDACTSCSLSGSCKRPNLDDSDKNSLHLFSMDLS